MKFYIVGTPIGNLGDITYRAIKTLKGVDLILCEDTRITKRLLSEYDIAKPLLSYHQHSKLSKVETIIEQIENKKTLALVTDAGTPGISDPGNKLIAQLVEHFGDDLKIIPIPGASALTALVSVAGIDMSKFVFLGFPPHKKGRETFFKKVLAACYPVCYYDSTHRFLKNLTFLKELAAEDDKKPRIVLGRELTKIFEEIFRGSLEDCIAFFEQNREKNKGEFSILIYWE